MKSNRVFLLVCLLAVFGAGYASCATIPHYLWAGELESGYAGKNHMKSCDVWKYLGEKGVRVIVAVSVEPGRSCPELYLFRPGTHECEAQAECTGATRFLVMDHTLESSGEYAVLVRSRGSGGIDYNLAFTRLDPAGTYTIDPDRADGDIILSGNTQPEVYMENDLVKGAAVILAPFMLLPKVVASSFYIIGSGVNLAVDLLNIPGIDLYRTIVSY